MSTPARRPSHPAGPAPQVGPGRSAGTPGANVEHLRENLRRVLADLRWPAFRWQVIAEAEAWGVSGVLHSQLTPLPDGRYPSLEALVEVLVSRDRFRTGPPPVVPGSPQRRARIDPASGARVAPPAAGSSPVRVAAARRVR